MSTIYTHGPGIDATVQAFCDSCGASATVTVEEQRTAQLEPVLPDGWAQIRLPVEGMADACSLDCARALTSSAVEDAFAGSDA